MRWLTCIHVDSDDDLRHHCLDDMARLLMWQVVAVRCRPLWIGLVTWRCHVVVVVWVVERLREVVGIGGGGDEAEVVDDGG